MDTLRFDQLTRLLGRATARRRLFAGLALSPLAGLVAARNSDVVAARKRRKNKGRKGKKPQPHAYGCLDVGKACNGDSSQCCSGICEGAAPKKGKKDKSRCVGHGALICKVDFDICTTGGVHLCKATSDLCACVLTTGDAPFCGDFAGTVENCQECSQDTDCHEGFGPGAACVVLGGVCELYCAGEARALCMPPCLDAEM